VAAGSSQAALTDCGPCSDGALCKEGSGTTTANAALCDAAFYVCPAGTEERLSCAAGKHNPGTGALSGIAACSDCDAGNFCEGVGAMQ